MAGLTIDYAPARYSLEKEKMEEWIQPTQAEALL